MKTLFTIQEAARFLSEASPYPLNEADVADLAKQERIPICFAIEGDIFPLTIEGNGMTQKVEAPVPFSGILRSLTPPASDEALLASMVEVVRVDGFRQTRAGNMEKITVKAKDHEWTAQRGSKVSGIALPTEQPHGGAIKDGCRVHGFINHTEIPPQHWRFEITDLRQMLESASEKPAAPENGTGAETETREKWEIPGRLEYQARQIGLEWMRKKKPKPGLIDIAKYVEKELQKHDIRGPRGDYWGWETIKKEALPYITGRKPNGKK